MKKRNILLAGTGIVLVFIVAGMLYTSHFASAVNQTQSHTASGAITATATPIPSTGLKTFQIVPAQTTASYSVYENLIFQNKPNNDAIGTTHSVQGSAITSFNKTPCKLTHILMPRLSLSARKAYHRAILTGKWFTFN